MASMVAHDVPIRSNIRWGWLQINTILRPYVWSNIGNGKTTSVWHGFWVKECPLNQYISNRSLTGDGFTIIDTLADVILEGSWKWPIRTQSGTLKPFVVSLAWDAICIREVPDETDDNLVQEKHKSEARFTRVEDLNRASKGVSSSW
ncbi:hypothetical protein Tco_0104490 [Tanacetum coccineum]